MPGVSGVPVVTTVCTLLSHTGCGCHEHPAFPAPSLEGRVAPSLEGRPRALRFQEPHVLHNSGARRRGIVKSYLKVLLEACSRLLCAKARHSNRPHSRKRVMQYCEAAAM